MAEGKRTGILTEKKGDGLKRLPIVSVREGKPKSSKETDRVKVPKTEKEPLQSTKKGNHMSGTKRRVILLFVKIIIFIALGSNEIVNQAYGQYPQEHDGDALVLAQFPAVPHDQSTDHGNLAVIHHRRIQMIAVPFLADPSLDRKQQNQHNDNCADQQRRPDVGIVHRRLLCGNNVQSGNVDIGGKQIVKRCILHRNSLVIQDQAPNASEDEHSGQRSDEGRNPDKTDPVSLPCADSQSDDQTNRDHQIGIPSQVRYQYGSQPANHTDHRAD